MKISFGVTQSWEMKSCIQPFHWIVNNTWTSCYIFNLQAYNSVDQSNHYDDQTNQTADGWSTLMLTWAFSPEECYLLFLPDILRNKSFLLKYKEYWNKHITIFLKCSGLLKHAMSISKNYIFPVKSLNMFSPQSLQYNCSMECTLRNDILVSSFLLTAGWDHGFT